MEILYLFAVIIWMLLVVVSLMVAFAIIRIPDRIKELTTELSEIKEEFRRL